MITRRVALSATVLALAAVPAAFAASDPSDGAAAQITGQRVHVGGGTTVTVSELRAEQRAQGRSDGVEVRPAPGERPDPARGNGRDVSSTGSRAAAGGRVATPTLGTSFLGAQLSESGALPPDSNGDVGPSQVFVDVNGRFKVSDKAGGSLVLNVDPDVFFSSVMTPLPPPPNDCNFTSDPHVRYDRLAQRWFITMIDVPGCSGNLANRVLMAVSSGPTITDSSSFTLFSFTGPAGEFADYDTLGVDANALYIGANMFSTSTGNFLNTDGYVVRKSDLLVPTAPLVTRFGNLLDGSFTGPFTPQGVDNDTPGATEGYFVGVDGAVFSKLDIRRVSNPGSATPTISGNLGITVPTTVFPINVPASGTTGSLDSLDDRLFAAMIATDPGTGQPRLWTAHNIQVNASGAGSNTGGRDGLRWYELGSLSTTPSLVQSGTVFDPAAATPASYWIPSIAANGAGQAVIASSTAGTGRFAQIAAAQRFPTDAAGFMSAPTTVQPSTFAYNPQGGGVQRWGDYSQTVVDPTDNQTFWTFQEYANATNSWGVRAIQLKAPPPATPASANPASVASGQASVSVQITGTSSNDSGFFDPGPDTGGPGFPNHIDASVSGGATVNGVTFTDPTHVTLDLNTTAASNGLQNVTITNPDGQQATGNNVLMIGADNTPPIPPTFTATDPASPANNNSPRILGNAEAGSTVRLYTDASCTGGIAATGSAASFASPGIAVSVLDNSTTTFRATATDAANNTSTCSPTSITYVEDSSGGGGGDVIAPETTLTRGPPAKTKKKKATFTFTSSEANARFQCRLDGGAFAACSSPDTLTGLKKGKHTFSVRAIDLAGNVDGTPATQSWKIKKKRRHHHHHHH